MKEETLTEGLPDTEGPTLSSAVGGPLTTKPKHSLRNYGSGAVSR